jgi:cytochrome c oxidase subunit 2
VVPVNKVITTASVIHAFMVPTFGINQDAIPGFVQDTGFAEGSWRLYGQCSKLCGKEQHISLIKVLSAADGAAGN